MFHELAQHPEFVFYRSKHLHLFVLHHECVLISFFVRYSSLFSFMYALNWYSEERFIYWIFSLSHWMALIMFFKSFLLFKEVHKKRIKESVPSFRIINAFINSNPLDIERERSLLSLLNALLMDTMAIDRLCDLFLQCWTHEMSHKLSRYKNRK